MEKSILKKLLSFQVAILLLLFSSVFFGCTSKVPDSVYLTYTGNLMGYVSPCKCPGSPDGGFARRAAALNKTDLKKLPLVYVDAGNFSAVGSNNVVEKTDRMLAAMKKMGVSAVSLGYRDIRQPLPQLQDFAVKYSIPFVSANLLDAETNQHPFPAHRIVKAPNGAKIGFIGVVQGGAFRKFPPNLKLKLEDPQLVLPREVQIVKDKAHYIVLLTDADRETITAWFDEIGTPDIDLIISSSNRMRRSTSILIDDIPLYATGRQGKYLDRIIATRDSSDHWTLKREYTRLRKDVGIDPEMKEYLTSLTSQLGLSDLRF